jgi:excisionase family DNA binding protein
MRTLNITEAADMLKIHENTVMELVGSGAIPGAKIGRAWVFIDDDLLAYVRKEIARQSAARVAGQGGNLRKAA